MMDLVALYLIVSSALCCFFVAIYLWKKDELKHNRAVKIVVYVLASSMFIVMITAIIIMALVSAYMEMGMFFVHHKVKWCRTVNIASALMECNASEYLVFISACNDGDLHLYTMCLPKNSTPVTMGYIPECNKILLEYDCKYYPKGDRVICTPLI